MEWPATWTDAFQGPQLHERWAGGHYNRSREGRIWLDGGLHIAFEQGRQYASAGVVTREPIEGDFDAHVRFEVENPVLGTTFELAAITVDPPRHSALSQDDADEFSRSRVYDVHGVPPYVSSEFDEADGWRIGWNRSSAQARPGAEGTLIADNHFNRYGNNAGPKPSGHAQGWLRLLREGTGFRSFRRDEQGRWQPTGAVSAMNLPHAVFLRLAAKHWLKTGLAAAPANHVRFADFALHQPA